MRAGGNMIIPQPMVMPPPVMFPGMTFVPMVLGPMPQQSGAASLYVQVQPAFWAVPFQVPAILRHEQEQRRNVMSNEGQQISYSAAGSDQTPPPASPPAGRITPPSAGGADDGSGVPTSSRQVFESFLDRHNAVRGNMSLESVSPNDLTGDISDRLRLTTFKALHDTLMYSRMIEALLRIATPSQVTNMIDLGAGSSIPTIRALIQVPKHPQLKVTAVDINAEAINISKDNTVVVGFSDRYTFIIEDMIDFLSRQQIGTGHIIVSNPPYMPIPAGEKDPFYAPVDGGPDGTKYLEQILSHAMPSGTIVGLRWCSLSNPVKLIKMIESQYEVLYLDANMAPFGPYARLTQDYLQQQQEKGLSVYYVNGENEKTFVFMSSVLRRK